MGGAVGCWGIAPVIADCIFTNNTATESGGAVGCYTSNPEIIDCRFIGNSADRGGAVALDGGLLRMSGCTLTENHAAVDGGGLYLLNAPAEAVEHCTFARNSAPRGAGMSIVSYSDMTCFFDNCIVAFGDGGEGFYWSGAGTLALACFDIFGNEGGDWLGPIADQEGIDGNLSADPMFCDTDAGDFHLQWGSPCLPANSGTCGLIGRYGFGGCNSVSIETTSWGQIKSMYRNPRVH